jgi:hypothetical protein
MTAIRGTNISSFLPTVGDFVFDGDRVVGATVGDFVFDGDRVVGATVGDFVFVGGRVVGATVGDFVPLDFLDGDAVFFSLLPFFLPFLLLSFLLLSALYDFEPDFLRIHGSELLKNILQPFYSVL